MWLIARCPVSPDSDCINKNMLTDTEWERLFDLRSTADHIHYYANQVYARRKSVEPHILHVLKCLSHMERPEQFDWYILNDVVYHLPTYQKTYHRYTPGDAPMISSHSMISVARTGVKQRKAKSRTQ